MKIGEEIFNGHSRMKITKVRDNGTFIARLNSAFITDSMYDYYFSSELNAWIKKSAPAKIGRIKKIKAE